MSETKGSDELKRAEERIYMQRFSHRRYRLRGDGTMDERSTTRRGPVGGPANRLPKSPPERVVPHWTTWSPPYVGGRIKYVTSLSTVLANTLGAIVQQKVAIPHAWSDEAKTEYPDDQTTHFEVWIQDRLRVGDYIFVYVCPGPCTGMHTVPSLEMSTYPERRGIVESARAANQREGVWLYPDPYEEERERL